MSEQLLTQIIIFMGAIGLLHYGVIQITIAAQNLFDKVFKVLAIKISDQPLRALGVGVITSTLVQSSTTTALMAVFLLNAGLLSFSTGMGLILGANVGGAVLPWLLTLHSDLFSFLLIALGAFPAHFSTNNYIKQLGRMVFSFGLIFYGIGLTSQVLEQLVALEGLDFSGTFLFSNALLAHICLLLIATAITFIFQSSSTVVAIILALTAVPFLSPMNLVMLVMGANLGGGLLTVQHSHRGNFRARHLALGHTIFNLVGIVLIISVFAIYNGNTIEEFPFIFSFEREIIVAIFYTTFNFLTAIVYLPFLNKIESALNRLFPKEVGDQYDYKENLDILGNPQKMLPGVALVVSAKQVERYREMMEDLYELTLEYLKSPDRDAKISAKIKNYEQLADTYKEEMAKFIAALMEKELSYSQSLEGHSLIKMTSELEAISDLLDKIATIRTKMGPHFNCEGLAEVSIINLFEDTFTLYKDVFEFVKTEVLTHYDRKRRKVSKEKFFERSRDLKEQVEKLKVFTLNNAKEEVDQTVRLVDIVNILREIRSRSIQILLIPTK